MKARRRRCLIMFVVLLSMTVLAAPARGSDWFSVHLSGLGFGLSVGSSDWWVHTRVSTDPYRSGGYDSVLTGYGEWNHLSSPDLSRHSVPSTAVRRSEPVSRMRTGPTAPTRSQMRQRGAEMVPEVELSRRTVLVGDRTVPEQPGRTMRNPTTEKPKVPATTRSSRANPSIRRTDGVANRDRHRPDGSRSSRPATADTTTAPSKPAIRQPEARTTTTQANTRVVRPERRGASTRPSPNARNKPAGAPQPTAGDADGDTAKPKARRR